MKTLVYSIFLLLLWSCNNRQHKIELAGNAGLGNIKDSAYGGSCPYLFTSKDSVLVMSWLRDVSDTQAVLCYAVAKNGVDFGATIVVPGSDNAHPHGENLSKVVLTPDGKILATWGASNPNPKNPYSGIVYYSWSLDEGKSWSAPQTLSRDTNSIDQRYFDIEILKDGNVAVVWLDSRKNISQEGSSLYFATFNNNNNNYVLENEKPIATTSCQCCRTDLFVDRQGYIHTVFRKIINDSIRDMVHAVSLDNGQTFSTPERISKDDWVINGCPHTGPAIAQTSNGLSFVWYTLGNGSGVFYTTSADNGKTFLKRDQVSNNSSAKHPQIEVAQGGEQLIVWDEGYAKGNRIGLEIRAADGKKIESGFITDSVSIASFPVIKSLGNKFIVAYTGRKLQDETEHVFYKLIDPL